MPFLQQPYTTLQDQQAMIALAHRFSEDHLHVIDLPYRFSSWACDDPENIGLWYAGTRLAGWAIMQSPFWWIDVTCDPLDTPQVLPLILDWASERARQILSTAYGHPAWYANVFPYQAQRIAALETNGFASQENLGEDSWSKVWMTRSAGLELPQADLPAGFRIRPLAGEAEVEAYVALHRSAFGTTNMTCEWRQRTLRRPEYRPELDLVIEAPSAELAAFCIAWLDPGGHPSGQIEPLGVLAGFRKLGLGKAILAEALRRLRLLGAEQIFVETDNYRDAALLLYESAGFQVREKVLVYRKDFPH